MVPADSVRAFMLIFSEFGAIFGGSKLPEANYRSGSCWDGGFLSSRVPGVVCRCSAKWVAEKSELY